MKSFNNYITEGAMVKMSPAEFVKYDWRIEVFLRKYKASEPFELANGMKMAFVYDPSIYKIMNKRNRSDLKDVRLVGLKNGTTYKLSDLGKSAEFGGRGSGSGTAKEDIELVSLQNQINAAKSKEASATITIKVGRKKYEVFGAETTPGVPKSDFHLVDINGKEVVWISHKDGRTAKDFQQWGGISKRKEPLIFNHKEVKAFVDDLKAEYPDGLPRATSLYRKINDKALVNMAVYGNEYPKKKLSRQNCSILIQGPVKLVKKGAYYEFKSNNIHFNGDPMTGPFEAVLVAIYKGDRSDAGVKGTRIVIMPVGGRKMKGTI